MSEARMVFYAALTAMLCITTSISHCTYQTAQCKQSAVKAGVPVEQISSLCRFNN